jgi:hypothetical protein
MDRFVNYIQGSFLWNKKMVNFKIGLVFIVFIDMDDG